MPRRARRAADLLLFASLVLPLLFFAGIAVQDRRQTLQAAKRDLLATLDTLHAHAEKVFQFQALALGAVADDLAGLDAEAIRRAAPQLQARLARLAREAGGEIGIVVIDAAGRPVLDSDRPTPAAISVADRDYFRHHRDTPGNAPLVAGPLRSRVDDAPILLVTRRRDTPDGRFDGVVAAVLRLSSLVETWQQAAPDPGDAVTLLRRDGTVLARRPAFDPGAEQPRLEPEGWVMQAITAGTERRTATGVSRLDGRERVFSFRGIARFPDLVIAHGMAVEAELAPWRRRTAILGAFAACFALALFGLALLERRRAIALGALNDVLEARVAERTAEARANEARVRLLAREVDHRAKNLLTVVQATLRLTPKSDPHRFAEDVEGRIAALARAQTLLAEDRWRGADLRALLEAELAPFVAEEKGAATLRGPALHLPAPLVQPLAMALHELATNAVKHGALSVPGGRVSVSWALRGEPTLFLHWQERGGPQLRGEPDRRGFGTRLLERVVRSQLGGRLAMAWENGGLACSIELPLPATE
ncbi:HWE histidine kinase domain-containing protein [Falsiroseomonas sp. HW251]|uniref:HWE histidine kinase domain-containing protein n=1 Tax=Falsiroseomonas sp. HW251 TaxID=3390998 RepID=UPI003D320D00